MKLNVATLDVGKRIGRERKAVAVRITIADEECAGLWIFKVGRKNFFADGEFPRFGILEVGD